MGKRYASVTEMVRDTVPDKRFQEEMEQYLSDRIIGKTLFEMRCSQGVTQTELAKRAGWPQSKVSKLEHATNKAHNINDLALYAKSLDLQVSLMFQPREMTAVERIKFHAFQIKKHLDHLARLANKDLEILKGVKDFFGEYLMNMLELFRRSASILPEPERKPLIEVCSPFEFAEYLEEDEDPCDADEQTPTEVVNQD